MTEAVGRPASASGASPSAGTSKSWADGSRTWSSQRRGPGDGGACEPGFRSRALSDRFGSGNSSGHEVSASFDHAPARQYWRRRPGPARVAFFAQDDPGRMGRGSSSSGPRPLRLFATRWRAEMTAPQIEQAESVAAEVARDRFWPLVREALAGSRRDLTALPLSRAVFLLAIPMVLEMVMESVFAVADIFWVSKLGADAVAAVGLTESL